MTITDIETVITAIEEDDSLRERLLNALFAEMYIYTELRVGERWVVAEVNHETYPLTPWTDGWQDDIPEPLPVPPYAKGQIRAWLNSPDTIAGIDADAVSDVEIHYAGNPA